MNHPRQLVLRISLSCAWPTHAPSCPSYLALDHSLAGLQRIYKSDPLTDDTFFSGCAADSTFKNLLLGLAFFHCVVVGRRLFGPVGFNIPYTFNANDLRISLQQLRLFLDEAAVVAGDHTEEGGAPPPLAMLTYTAGECNYGGKVEGARLPD
jgi:dynein heavy chain, axonemal